MEIAAKFPSHGIGVVLSADCFGVLIEVGVRRGTCVCDGDSFVEGAFGAIEGLV
jgi:C4-dicarboxylate transporter